MRDAPPRQEARRWIEGWVQAPGFILNPKGLPLPAQRGADLRAAPTRTRPASAILRAAPVRTLLPSAVLRAAPVRVGEAGASGGFGRVFM